MKAFLRNLQEYESGNPDDLAVVYIVSFVVFLGLFFLCATCQIFCSGKKEDDDPYRERPSIDSSSSNLKAKVLPNSAGKEIYLAQPVTGANGTFRSSARNPDGGVLRPESLRTSNTIEAELALGDNYSVSESVEEAELVGPNRIVTQESTVTNGAT